MNSLLSDASALAERAYGAQWTDRTQSFYAKMMNNCLILTHHMRYNGDKDREVCLDNTIRRKTE